MEAESIVGNITSKDSIPLPEGNGTAIAMGNLDQQRAENIRSTYQLLCESYHAIDTFRMQLLGLLPLTSAAGIFFLVNNTNVLDPSTPKFLGPASLFGVTITLGLLSFEIHGIKKCHYLIETAKCLEASLGLRGQFRNHPEAVFGWVNEPFAGGIVYSSVLAAWSYLGLRAFLPSGAGWVALAVFSMIFAFVVGYGKWLQRTTKNMDFCT